MLSRWLLLAPLALGLALPAFGWQPPPRPDEEEETKEKPHRPRQPPPGIEIEIDAGGPREKGHRKDEGRPGRRSSREDGRFPGKPAPPPPPGGPFHDGPGGPPRPPGFGPHEEHPDPVIRGLMEEEHLLERRSREISERLRDLRHSRGDAKRPDPADKTATSGSADEKLKAELRETIVKQFEVRQKLRRAQVDHMESRLKSLRDSIEQREKNRNTIIDRRLAELLGDEDVGF